MMCGVCSPSSSSSSRCMHRPALCSLLLMKGKFGLWRDEMAQIRVFAGVLVFVQTGNSLCVCEKQTHTENTGGSFFCLLVRQISVRVPGGRSTRWSVVFPWREELEWVPVKWAMVGALALLSREERVLYSHGRIHVEASKANTSSVSVSDPKVKK